MLVNFGPGDLLTRWEIDLFSPPGSVLPVVSIRGIDLLVSRTALGGTKSHVTLATELGYERQTFAIDWTQGFLGDRNCSICTLDLLVVAFSAAPPASIAVSEIMQHKR